MSVDLFSADYSRLTDSELYSAIFEFTRQNLPQSDRAQEGYTVDFKEKWNEKSLRVVAAFANTFGGIVVIGVSDDCGRAKDLVGEESRGEMKTKLANSISANITPTPTFEIAECTLEDQPDRRLAVIRVRPSNKIHFLTTKDCKETPVYVRNEDQAIPAAASELRNLIQRERDHENSQQLGFDQNRLQNLLTITKAHRTSNDGGNLLPRQQRVIAPSVFRLWAIPNHMHEVLLDYETERDFCDLTKQTFRTFRSPKSRNGIRTM